MAALRHTATRAGHQQRIERAETEIDNLRAAFAWSRENSDTGLALALASALQPLWLTRGRIREGLAWFDAALTDQKTHPAAVAPVRARALADKVTAQAQLESDVLLGTSAGSTVPAQLGSGVGLDALFDRQVAAASPEINPGVDIDDITDLFVTAMAEPNTTTAEKLQRIGKTALSTPTVAESVRRAVIAGRLPSHEWPDRVLRIPAIDTASGELVAFDRGSGVALVDAVAARCAVPGAWPPVTIGDRRYRDGGVGSTINLALAGDCDVAVGTGAGGSIGTVTVRRRRRRGDRRVSWFAVRCVRRRRVADRVRRQPARPRVPGAVGAGRSRAGPPSGRRHCGVFD